MRASPSAISLLLAASAVIAQPQDARAAFEAATVKLNTSGDTHNSSHSSGSQIIVTNLALKRLIERAYAVGPDRVTGPPWLEDVREDRPRMLRTLLEDQFKPAVHRATKDLPGYALVVARGGFKLHPVEPGACHIGSGGEGFKETLEAKKTSMALLAEHLARYLSETVVDKSGLAGVYDLELHWTIDENTGRDNVDAARLAGLQEALASIGLHLHVEKVPVEIVVVDRIERAPVDGNRFDPPGEQPRRRV
ncbi:MAG TPA: TIGR03435 family protein [Candidatus Sulfopaludibacter sp.]|nr:TIGR03435 family protein [Candidatus Sulfopaludibacter sp.]